MKSTLIHAAPRSSGMIRVQRRAGHVHISTHALKKAEPGSTIGFAGMGIMGVSMAKRLANAGYDLLVWNRSPAACAPLLELGARMAETPAQLAAAADYTFAMLADDAAAESVVMGPAGIREGIAGKGYVDMSTLSEPMAVEIGFEIAQAGGHCLEAPVSGSKAPAEQGQLIFLTSGSEELYHAVAGPLDVMGKAKFFLGDSGAGTRMKLVVNMVMAAQMAALAEGLHLAERSGLQPSQLVEILGLGAMASPMIANKGPAMVANNFPTAFPYKHQLKDLAYALDMANDSDAELQVAAATLRLYESAVAQLGEQDFSAVLEAVRGASKLADVRTAK